MRTYSLMFALIALVILAMFLIYVIRGPVDPVIAGGLFVSFLACAVPALSLLKPFTSREEFLRVREERRQRREAKGEDSSRDRGS